MAKEILLLTTLRRHYTLWLICSFTAGVPMRAQWELTQPEVAGPAQAYDLIVDPYGRVHVAVTRGALGQNLPTGHILQLHAVTGELLHTTNLVYPGSLTSATHIYWESSSQQILVTGQVGDSSDIDGAAWLRAAISKLDADQMPSEMSCIPIGPSARNLATGRGVISSNGSLVFGHYTYQDFWNSIWQGYASKFDPISSEAQTVLLNEWNGDGRVHALVEGQNGEFRAVLPLWLEGCSAGSSSLLKLTPALEPTECHGLEPVEQGAFGVWEYFRDHIGLVVLPSDNMIISGYYTITYDQNLLLTIGSTALQRITSSGEVLSQRILPSAFFSVGPSDVRAVGLYGTREMFVGVQDGYQFGFGIPLSQEPSNIHVYHMDTALNILGEFKFDGFVQNRYYNLNSTVAGPDGSVYVIGSVYDFDDPVPNPKAWVAKIGLDQFVTVPEVVFATLHMFPNPGTSGFTVQLEQPVSNGRLVVHDMYGRMVVQEQLNGVQMVVDMARSSPGLYTVHVIDNQGAVVARSRWVKA